MPEAEKAVAWSRVVNVSFAMMENGTAVEMWQTMTAAHWTCSERNPSRSIEGGEGAKGVFAGQYASATST